MVPLIATTAGPAWTKNSRHVQVLQQMDCAAQEKVSDFPSSTPGVGSGHQLQDQGKGTEGQLLLRSMGMEQQGKNTNKFGSWERFSSLDGEMSGPHPPILLHP